MFKMATCTHSQLKSTIYSFKYDSHLKNTEVNKNSHDKQTILIQVEFVVELFTFTRVQLLLFHSIFKTNTEVKTFDEKKSSDQYMRKQKLKHRAVVVLIQTAQAPSSNCSSFSNSEKCFPVILFFLFFVIRAVLNKLRIIQVRPNGYPKTSVT